MRPPGPKDPAGVLRLLDEGGAHFAAGRLDDAARAYERAERTDPADFRATYSLAIIDLNRARPERAIPRLKRVAAKKPDLFEAWHNLGAANQALARWDEAAAAFEQAVALRSDALETRRQLALVLAILGRIDDALAQHAVLADQLPTRVWALTRIALLRPGALDVVAIDDLARASADPKLPPDQRIPANFALGQALEAKGHPDEAFAAFAEGNRQEQAKALARGIDPSALVMEHAATIERVRARFSPEFLAAQAGKGALEPAPIFIVGLPRSGSTLIEQILGAHPRAQALGETGALPELLETGVAMADAPDWRGLAKDYARRLRRLGWREGQRPIDKTLENYLHVGAIALMFPRATILHAVRDPVDTCLSAWRLLFPEGGEALTDLAEIGREFVDYRRMMDHWAEALPGRVIDIDHEALVADPEARIRWLVTEACALPWNPATLAFHEGPGPVLTASAAQVRQPIFTTSLQRWRRYEAHLGPLLEALGPYAPKL